LIRLIINCIKHTFGISDRLGDFVLSCQMWLMSRSRNHTPWESLFFVDGIDRSCLTSSYTSLRQWTAIWHQYDQCLQGIDNTHTQHSRFVRLVSHAMIAI
jgi:hypothetical protein